MVFKQKYRIGLEDCGRENKATNKALLAILEDVAGFHSATVGLGLNEINAVMLENAKANAAYKAAMLEGADIILGATFYVTNNKKLKGLDVVVRGYPAKYVNFHNYGENPNDSKWIEPLQEGARIRSLSIDQKQNKAVGGEIRTK